MQQIDEMHKPKRASRGARDALIAGNSTAVVRSTFDEAKDSIFPSEQDD